MSDNRPTTKDLVEAVREFLETCVMPVVQGQTAFHARVAANVLAIVERELELGAGFDAEEHTRLKRLLKKDGTRAELNRELCLRIREGVVDYEDPALVDHLRRTTMGRLSIDNPRYSAYQRAQTFHPLTAVTPVTTSNEAFERHATKACSEASSP